METHKNDENNKQHQIEKLQKELQNFNLKIEEVQKQRNQAIEKY